MIVYTNNVYTLPIEMSIKRNQQLNFFDSMAPIAEYTFPFKLDFLAAKCH